MIGLFAAAPSETVLETLKSLRFSNADAAWVHGVISRWSVMTAEVSTRMSDACGTDDAKLPRRGAAIVAAAAYD